MMSKLGDFYFLSLRHILTKLEQNWSIRGAAAALFSLRRPENFENEKISLCLEIAEINMGINFGSKRMILDIKTHFFKS